MLDSLEGYVGKWRDIPFDACKDYWEGRIKYNIDEKSYVCASVLTLLSLEFIPFIMLGMILDKLRLNPLEN